MALSPSGNTSFAPANSDLMLEAYERLQIRPSALVQEHVLSAFMSANLILLEWGLKGVNLWAIDRQSTPMVQGSPSYTLPADTVQVLEVVRSVTSGGTTTDTVMTPISVTDYNALPVKLQQGPPTNYWFNRQAPAPIMTLWPVPDAAGPYTLNYYRMRRIQSMNMLASEGQDMPDRFIPAFVAEWAAKLAVKWRPERKDALKMDAVEAWGLASNDDSEKVSTYVQPDMTPYWR